MKVLFPSETLDKNRNVDSLYLEEQHAAKLQMHDCYLYDHTEFVKNDNFVCNIPQVEDDTPLVLRGFMFTVPQYEKFYNHLRELGYLLTNTPEQYKNCHHFPESYDYTKDYTSKSIFVREWDAEILQDISNFFGDKNFLMKDFVKSAKGYLEDTLFKMSAGITGEELLEKVEKFIDYRGDKFSDGLVFKEFANLKQYEDVSGNSTNNEWRIFYRDNKVMACSQNSNLQGREFIPTPDRFMETKVNEIAFQIDSNFFTIDVAELESGKWMIIETGDGQVSGLSPDQNCLEFFTSMENKVKV